MAIYRSSSKVGCITRLVLQKGVHLIRHAIYRTLELGGQFVFLGPSPVPHIQDTTISAGAVVSEDGIAETFNNDDEALDTVDKGTVVVDLSHYGRIRVSGEDRAHFLHNQSTADFDSLREGQKTAITLVVSPGISRSITEMLNKKSLRGLQIVSKVTGM